MNRVARVWSAVCRDQQVEYMAHAEPPEPLLSALSQAVSVMTEAMGEQPDIFTADTLRFYFDAVHFTRIAERFGAHSVFDITLSDRKNSVLCVNKALARDQVEFKRPAAITTATNAPEALGDLSIPLPEIRTDPATEASCRPSR